MKNTEGVVCICMRFVLVIRIRRASPYAEVLRPFRAGSQEILRGV